MAFLKTLFWIVLTVVLVTFALHNWTVVTINLWGGLQADAKLPVLLLLAFLLGFAPTYIHHRAWRWRMGRRLDSAERALAMPGPEPDAARFTMAPPPVTGRPIPPQTPQEPI